MTTHQLESTRNPRMRLIDARCSCGGWQMRAPLATPADTITTDHALHVERARRMEAA